MKWASRIMSMINGGIFAYWCHLGTINVDWRLWAKFMIASLLGFMAGDLYRRAKVVNNV